MCKDSNENKETEQYKGAANSARLSMPRESHIVYELKQKRDYLLRQLLIIEKAIEAVSNIPSLD